MSQGFTEALALGHMPSRRRDAIERQLAVGDLIQTPTLPSPKLLGAPLRRQEYRIVPAQSRRRRKGKGHTSDMLNQIVRAT